jgi:antitoxin component YwqK of YwqJK toxin-antitoxin module
MPRVALAPLAFAAALAALAAPALAVESCELNGEHVNPNNGNTTAGKTGLMRCRDGEGGAVIREQELKGGVFMGIARWFDKDGALLREQRVNERGNRDGLAREYERAGAEVKPVLVRESTYRDGSAVGIVRTWTRAGTLERVAFHGDDGREQASAEFTKDGRLFDLRCGPRPLLAPYADDAHWCGHVGGPSEVVLYNGKGEAKARLVHERGERRKGEYLSAGIVREQRETSDSGGVERAFYENGTKRREVQWVSLGGERSRRVTTLEQEFHESGKRVHEKRWKVGERGGELVSEQHWFLNGQPRDRTDYAVVDGQSMRTETAFHDNGRKASEGAWRVAGRGDSQPTGTHRSWDSDGVLRAEVVYDERGRLARERQMDASGKVVRDDEVFEDGSRKALGK